MDVALMNAGGCRDDIKAGIFTLGDAYNVLPFDDDVVLLRLSGAEIKQTLEHAVSFLDESDSGSFPVGAGLRWDLNLLEQAGSRISNLQVNPRLEDGSLWRSIDPDEVLKVATSSYLANGKNGYFSLGTIAKSSNSNFENTFIDHRQAFISFVKDKRFLSDPPLSEYSTQLLIDKDGRVTSIRALREKQLQAVSTVNLLGAPLSPTQTNPTPRAAGIVIILVSLVCFRYMSLNKFRLSRCGRASSRGYQMILP